MLKTDTMTVEKAITELAHSTYTEMANSDRIYYQQNFVSWLRRGATARDSERYAYIDQIGTYQNRNSLTPLRFAELAQIIFQIPFQLCRECHMANRSERLREHEGQMFCINCRPPDWSQCQNRASLEFQFPTLSLPQKFIPNDTPFDLSVGAGDISGSGLRRIRDLIYDRTGARYGNYGINLPELTHDETFAMWQTAKGNFTKRLGKLLLETRSVKLTEEFMAEIGNIARQYTAETRTFKVEFTRNINRPASAFAHRESCWWSSHWQSRCQFKNLGGMGIRTFNSQDKVSGRCWLIPLEIANSGRIWQPSFKSNSDAYIAFNAYGHELMPFSRMVAQLTGKSYRKVELNGSRMYINGHVGVLIASQEVCDANSTVTLSNAQSTCKCAAIAAKTGV